MECDHAFLVYPMQMASPLDMQVGTVSPIRVTAVGFDISGDLEAAGLKFLEQILTTMKVHEAST
jgi:hypothetical protein